MNKSLQCLLYSNAFIAISGGMYAFHDAINNEFHYPIYSVIFLITITWLSYQIPLINCFFLSNNIPTKAKDSWFVEHKNLMLFLTAVLMAIAGTCSFYLNSERQTLVIILSFISLSYVMPNILFRYSLRKIPYLKIFLIAGSWAALSVFWWQQINQFSITLFCIRFITLIAITLPFDIRDLDEDKTNDLKTIPMLFNHSTNKTIIFSLLAISFFLCLITPNITIFEYYLIFIAALTLLLYTPSKTDIYFYLLVDGIFIIHVITIFASLPFIK